jgi:outer membrane lipoprotein
MKHLLIVLLTIVVLSGCVSVPEPLRGDYPPLTPNAVTARDIGQDIRWGGIILATQPDENQTCFEVLSRQLSTGMRPLVEDMTQGRFIACRDGFLDPEVFVKGREVTLTGEVVQMDQRLVGEFEYRYPVIAARFITMWPERPEVIINNYYDPFYDPWYWGPYYGRHPYGGFHYSRSTINSGKPTERVDVPADSRQQQ